MRTHQPASSASSAREKCTRPLVVGPSPVMTPSRTMVSAWAAVSRQEGSRALIASANLDFTADIVSLLSSVQFLVLGQNVDAGVNEWLMIRNLHSAFFKWLPIGRIYSRKGSRSRPGGRDESHKRRHRGNPQSLRSQEVFSSQGRRSKEGARGSLNERIIYSSSSHPFT